MEMKEIYTKLEAVENGADMIAAIKAEINRLNNESKTNRQNGETATAKVKSILERLNLQDGDDVLDKVKELKTTLDGFAQDGKTPSDVAKQIATLTSQITTVNKQLADMTKTATEEKAKRFGALKTNALVDALTKNNAAAPNDMAKLIADKVTIDDTEAMTYKDGEKNLSVADGVKTWLAANPWAVKANGNNGGGSGGAGSHDDDPFL